MRTPSYGGAFPAAVLRALSSLSTQPVPPHLYHHPGDDDERNLPKVSVPNSTAVASAVLAVDDARPLRPSNHCGRRARSAVLPAAPALRLAAKRNVTSATQYL